MQVIHHRFKCIKLYYIHDTHTKWEIIITAREKRKKNSCVSQRVSCYIFFAFRFTSFFFLFLFYYFSIFCCKSHYLKMLVEHCHKVIYTINLSNAPTTIYADHMLIYLYATHWQWLHSTKAKKKTIVNIDKK